MSKDLEPIYQALAARVRMIRETLGLDQSELAKRAGWSRASLANFETGRQRASLDKVEQIAKALGTNPKNLMKGIWW